jgi:hypothetical protein
VRGTVGEEEIDDQAANWEEEDESAPENLVGNWARALEDFNC